MGKLSCSVKKQLKYKSNFTSLITACLIFFISPLVANASICIDGTSEPPFELPQTVTPTLEGTCWGLVHLHVCEKTVESAAAAICAAQGLPVQYYAEPPSSPIVECGEPNPGFHWGSTISWMYMTSCPSGYSPGSSGCELKNPGEAAHTCSVYTESGPASCPAPVGNPINVTNYNKYQVETDYTGAGELPLMYQRSYNSRLSVGKTALGRYWRSSYDAKLMARDDSPENLYPQIPKMYYFPDGYRCEKGDWCVAACNASDPSSPCYDTFTLTTMLVERPDGKVYTFRRDVALAALSYVGQWLPDPSAEGQLEKLTSGWKYTTTNNTVEIYDKHGHNGRLASITDLKGNGQTLSYNSANGYLDTVTSSHSESLTFQYYDTEPLDGLVKSITDHAGRTWGYRYDANKNLQYVDNPDLTTREYHYEDTNFVAGLTGITDERRVRYSTYAYDASQRPIMSSHAGDVERVDIDYNGLLRTVTNSRGIASIYTTETTPLGVPLVTGIEGPGCSTCGGSNSNYVYDPATNNLLSITDNGITTQYGDYDSNDNYGYKIEAVGTPQQRRSDYTYDPRFHSKIATVSEPSIYTGNPDARKVTTYTYDDFGNLTTTKIDAFKLDGTPISRTSSYQYSGPFHQLSQADGPRTDIADITTLSYYLDDPAEGNNRARLKTITDATGENIRDNIQYSATGKVLSEQRLNGLSVSYAYYPGNDRLETISETAGGDSNITRLTYLATGEVETITQGYGSAGPVITIYSYDDARRLTGVTDQQGNSIEYVLDTEGNLEATHIKDASNTLSRTQTRSYDDLNQLFKIIGAANQTTEYGYDAQGNLDTVIDPLNNVTSSVYDALDRLEQTTDALNGITSYTYDAHGNLETVTDPRDNTTVYQYDGLGNLTQLDSPDTGITNYTGYDAEGNLTEQTDAKDQTTVYAYDSLNRLTQITYDDNSTTVYAYDVGANAKGRLSSITDPSGSTVYAYDQHGRITNKTQAIDTTSLPVAYHYNAQGQLDQITYPSGKVIGYSYSNGQISQLTVDGVVVLNNISYDPFGPVTGWDMGAGQSPNSISRLYDLDGQLSSYTLAGATKQLSYANTGNITSLLEVSNPANDQTFDYDGLYRLTDYSGLGDTHVYGYDANGNRTAQVINGTGYGYSLETDNNRLQSVAGPTAKTYGYDALGNTISDGLHTYNYDARNRLTGLGTGIGAGISYGLNGLGQRVAKSIPTIDPNSLSGDANNDGSVNAADYSLILDHILGIQAANNADCNEDGLVNDGDLICVNIKSNGLSANGKTHYVYDEQGQLIGEYDKDGNVILETVYLGNLPVAVLKDGNVYYIHADHLNTPRAITDAANNTYWSWLSDPFGVTAANDDVDGDGTAFTYNLRFPGQYLDEETGLHYNYFRDYDPGTGRYVQSDPIGLMPSLNTYAYVDSDPLDWADPSGLRRSNGRFIPYRSRYRADRWTYANGREFYRLEPPQMSPGNSAGRGLIDLFNVYLPKPWEIADYNRNLPQGCKLECGSGAGAQGEGGICNSNDESSFPEYSSCNVVCK